MSNDVELSVIQEPQDHFTSEDDSYLHKLISPKEKGNGGNCAVLKPDMMEVTNDIMAHWYNLHGVELNDYNGKFFDSKWYSLDENHKGQIECDETKKFVRDLIGGMI